MRCGIAPDLEQRKKCPGLCGTGLVASDPDVLAALHRRAERKVQEQKKNARKPARDDRARPNQKSKDPEGGSRFLDPHQSEQVNQPGGEGAESFCRSAGARR